MATLAGKTGAIYYRKAYIQASTIALNDADPDTITDSGNGLVTAGFEADDLITISGSVADDGNYTIDTGGVAAGTITLVIGDALTGEVAGNPITVQEALPGTQVLGFHNWSVDLGADSIETTRFEDVGVETSIEGVRRWTATAERFYETTQITPESWLGTELIARFFTRYDASPNVTNAYYYQGKCRVSGISPATTTDGAGTVSYTFTGTKKASIGGTTLTFVEGGATDTITDSGSRFITAGFDVGDSITVAGSTSNDGVYTLSNVAAGTLTLTATVDDLVGEVALIGTTIFTDVGLITRSTEWPT